MTTLGVPPVVRMTIVSDATTLSVTSVDRNIFVIQAKSCNVCAARAQCYRIKILFIALDFPCKYRKTPVFTGKNTVCDAINTFYLYLQEEFTEKIYRRISPVITGIFL